MYATIHRFRRWPDEESEEWATELLSRLTDGTEPLGACVLGRLDGMDGAVFALWEDQAGAAQAAGWTGEGARWLDASAFAVLETDAGTASGTPPRFAQLAWLDTAGDAARADTALRSGRERISPAVRDVEGVVGTYVLRSEDHRMVVVTLVTSVETPDALRAAIFATRLLPWEDPEQLVDVERLDVDRVLVARMPAPAEAEVRS
ncbi:MAG TPA: hypothetical protein VK402_02715 [Blastococcus sp.]|nr:hypothetical protein [Blastococcus sp.]